MRAGWLAVGRAGLASPGEGGTRAGPPARSLALLLPPSLGRWVRQSVRQQPAGPRAAESPRLGARASSCHCSLGGCSGGRGTPGPGATGEARRRRRRASGVGGCGAVPEGTVLAAAAPPQTLCL